MQLTRATDFSLRVLMYFAGRPGLRARAADLARLLGIPPQQMMKIVQRLARTGYVHAQRGKGGGIRLARAAEDIRIGAVIRDIEPNLALVNCLKPACPLAGNCRLKHALNHARDGFLEEMDKLVLADLVIPQPLRTSSEVLNPVTSADDQPARPGAGQ